MSDTALLIKVRHAIKQQGRSEKFLLAFEKRWQESDTTWRQQVAKNWGVLT